MSLMDHVRSVFSASERFDQIVDLGREFAEADNDTKRLEAGSAIADHWDAIADECEQSAATRMLFNSWTPAEMRAEAAIWREGRDPHE